MTRLLRIRHTLTNTILTSLFAFSMTFLSAGSLNAQSCWIPSPACIPPTAGLDYTACMNVYVGSIWYPCSNNCTGPSGNVSCGSTPPTISITSNVNESCPGAANGMLTATTVDGTPNYTYSWSNSSSTSGTSSLTNQITGLSAATYTVTVTDNDGNTATASATVSASASTVTASTSVSSAIACNGGTGSTTVTPGGGSGGYTYLWSDASAQTTQTASGLANGTYSVTVTDNTGCTATGSTSLTEPSVLSGGTITTN